MCSLIAEKINLAEEINVSSIHVGTSNANETLRP